MRVAFAVLGFAGTILTACTTAPAGCDEGTGLAILPVRDTTLFAGMSFELVYQEGDHCSDGRALNVHRVHRRWTTLDTRVIAIDTATERVTALSEGTARISDRAYHVDGEPDPVITTVHVMQRTAARR